MLDALPTVSGITETGPEGDSLPMRLAAMLSRQTGGASQDIAGAMSMLQNAYTKESNGDVRAKIQAALGLLGGCGEDYTSED
jgi:hypothetical protein